MPMSPAAGGFATQRFDYDGGRQATVYVPPDPAESVVFAADGAWHIAPLSKALTRAGATSTMIVGVHGLTDDRARLEEYSPPFNAERFAAHEKFFVEDVRRRVGSEYGLVLDAEHTAVWGASIGGELALALGIRHPDVYGAVLCASPGAGYRPPEAMPPRLPRAYLVAGTQEPFFLKNATRWALALRGAGADVALTERAGSHGGAFWAEEFPLMAKWAFGR
jgi:enterochelin esterase-like enzyme